METGGDQARSPGRSALETEQTNTGSRFVDAMNARAPLALLVLLGLALILRLWTLPRDSLWVDEAYTLAISNLPLGQLWSVPFDTHPPLHFTVVKLFDVFLDGEWASRMPSVIAGTLTVLPIYALARRFYNTTGALAAAAMFALPFTQLVYANNGRNYAMVVFLLAVALYALVRFVQALEAGERFKSAGTLRWAGAYILAGATALYTHNIAILYLFVLNGAICLKLLLNDPRGSMTPIASVAGINAVMLALALPWLAGVLTTTGGIAWIQHYSPIDAIRTLIVTIGPNETPLILVFLFFAALGVGWFRLGIRLSWPNVLIGTHLVLFPVFIWALGFVYLPMFAERAILPAAFGAALAIGALVGTDRPGRLSVGLAAVALLGTAWSAGAYILRSNTADNLGGHLVQDWRAAVTEHDTAETTLILCSSFEAAAVDEYRAASDLFVYRPEGLWDIELDGWMEVYGRSMASRLGGYDLPDATPLAQLADVPVGEDGIVFLKPDIFCNAGEADALRQALSATGFVAIEPRDYRGVTAERYRPAD